jgi:hypothetical protein
MRSVLAGLRQLVLPWGAPTGAPQLVLSASAPALLVTFYAPNSITASQIAYATATDYAYTVWLDIVSTGEQSVVSGWVHAGGVYETQAFYLDPASGVPRTVAIGDFFGGRTDGTFLDINGVTGAALNPAASNYSSVNIGQNVDLSLGNISAGRGILTNANASSGSNSAAIGAAETAIVTLTNVLFPQNRAFVAEFGSMVTASLSTNTAHFLLRATNAGGTLYGDAGAFGPSGAAAPVAANGRLFLRRALGSDLTTTVVLTMVASGGGTVTQTAFAYSPRYMIIRDIGAYNDYPNAVPVT